MDDGGGRAVGDSGPSLQREFRHVTAALIDEGDIPLLIRRSS